MAGAHTSHTRNRSKFTLPSSSSSSLSTPNPTSKNISGRTPPPSPSPFMRSFYASQPSTSILPGARSLTPRTLSSQALRRPFSTLRRIWKEDQLRFRRFFLVLLLVVLPTLLIAAYFASAAGAVAASYRMAPVDAPISGFVAVAHQDQGGGAHGGGDLKRRWAGVGALVPRQAASTSSIDSADAPVLSLGNGLGSGVGTTTRGTTISNSGILGATPTTTLRTSTTAPSVPSDPILPTPFVQPFDTTLSTDFLTGTCQTFFTNLTQSLSFRQCRPFSLLLPTSQDFITAQSNLTLLTAILYGTCTTIPSAEECTARMDALGGDLKTACAAELNDGHALSWDALNGMKNYAMMRDAGCLRNLRTNAYCFADALAASPPSDVYFYQLPLGTPLPGTSSTSSANSPASTSSGGGGAGGSSKVNVVPTCSACTQSLMGIYARYATNDSLLISETYDAAQRLVDTTCGSGYASVINGAAPACRGVLMLSLSLLFSVGVLLATGL